MEQAELERAVEAILFAAGEPVAVERLAMATATTPEQAEQAAQADPLLPPPPPRPSAKKEKE